MKKELNEFIEEITNNFSELFVETFFIRYLSDYSKNDLLDVIQETKKILDIKLENNIKYKLNELGFNNIDINKKEE